MVFLPSENLAINVFPVVMNAKMVILGVPYTMSYDAMTHLFTFDNLLVNK